MFNLFKPAESINYNFVSGMYGICSLIFLILLVAQKYTDTVEGFYIVFAPFVPCLLWSLVVRQNWLTKEELAVKETKKD